MNLQISWKKSEGKFSLDKQKKFGCKIVNIFFSISVLEKWIYKVIIAITCTSISP